MDKSQSKLEAQVNELVQAHVREMVAEQLERVAGQLKGQPVKTRAKVRKTASKPQHERGAGVAALRKVLSSKPLSASELEERARKVEPGLRKGSASIMLSVMFNKGECNRTGTPHKYMYSKKVAKA